MSQPTPNTTNTFPVPHPTLGPLTGLIRTPSVLQFRSIPFARIPGRFRQSVLITEPLAASERDCTRYTYACPQHEQDQSLFGGRRNGEPERRYDEFRCLNLTVTLPRALVDGDRDEGNGKGGKVPVLVYVHGGAFKEGAAFGSVQDTVGMVELGCREGMEVVIVNIQYRLNWFGFLACDDFIKDAAANNELPCNYGLLDQRQAFLWIQNHISGFGGDPDNVTAFGESAGSASLCLHMCSTVPLFKRAILQSGSPSTSTPTEPGEKLELQYFSLLKACGIDENDPERLQKLRQVLVQTMLDALATVGPFAMHPFDDRGFLPETPNYDTQGDILARCPWVDEIIIGDDFDEGYLFSALLEKVKRDKYFSFVERHLGTEGTNQVLQAYGITAEMDDNLFWRRMTTFTGDVAFSFATHSIAQALIRNETPKKVYRYTITLRNPFIGSSCADFPGHHAIEIGFLFASLMDRYTHEWQKRASLEFARRWIKFAHGQAPWRAYTKEDQTIAVVTSEHGWLERTRQEDERVSRDSVDGERRYQCWDTLREVLSRLDPDARLRAVDALGLIDFLESSQKLH